MRGRQPRENTVEVEMMEALLLVLLVSVASATTFFSPTSSSIRPPSSLSALNVNEEVLNRNVRWLVKRTLSLEPTESGLQIPRAVLALYLADPMLFYKNATGEALKKKLWLHMNLRISYSQSSLRGYDYALYALASKTLCVRMVNLDVLRVLRDRLDRRTPSPIEILALCYARANVTEIDVQRVAVAFNATNKTDTKAMAVLAMECLSLHVDVDMQLVRAMQEELKKRQSPNGTVGTTALVIQALMFNDNFEGFDLRSAWNLLVKAQEGRRGRIVRDALYAIPVLLKKSFFDFGYNHYCEEEGKDEKPRPIKSSVDRFRYRVWGEKGVALPKGILTLFLENPSFLDSDFRQARKLKESLFQVPVEISSDMATRNDELALYVQALLVSCEDPRDFFGRDLVSELRARVDGSFANPFEILALCNAGANVSIMDVEKVSAAFNSRPISLNTRAIATIAMQCLSSRDVPVAETKIRAMQERLKELKIKNNTHDDRVTTALVLQALRINFNFAGFDLQRALETLTEAFFWRTTSDSWESDVHRAFYILPAVYGKSFLDFTNKHCPVTGRRKSKTHLSSSEDLIPHFVYTGEVGDLHRWKFFSLLMTWSNRIRDFSAAETFLRKEGRENMLYSGDQSYLGQKPSFCFIVHNRLNKEEMGVFWLKGDRKLKLPTLDKTGQDYNKMKPLEKLSLWYERNFENNNTCISILEDDEVGFWYTY